MKQEKKNQHYVPKSHLRGFTIEGKKSLIWGYDKRYTRISKTPKSISYICSKDYYYEQRMPDGQTSQILEDGFNQIETPAIAITRKLYSQHDLSASDKGKLACYIAFLLVRGPSFRDGCLSALKKIHESSVQKMYEMGALPEPPEEIRKLIINGDITSAVNTVVFPDVSIRYMLSLASQISASLCNKKWDIFFSEDGYFVTSDTPVMFGDPPGTSGGIGPSHPQSLIICPITKNMTVVARPYDSSDDSAYECKSAESEMTKKLNQLMCFKAHRYVYAPEKSEQLLEYIKSAKGFSQSLKSYKFGNGVILKWDTDKK